MVAASAGPGDRRTVGSWLRPLRPAGRGTGSPGRRPGPVDCLSWFGVQTVFVWNTTFTDFRGHGKIISAGPDPTVAKKTSRLCENGVNFGFWHKRVLLLHTFILHVYHPQCKTLLMRVGLKGRQGAIELFKPPFEFRKLVMLHICLD